MQKPPYYAVIFTSLRTDVEQDYAETNDALVAKAEAYEGFLGQDSARSEIGIAVSYWKTLEDIKQWKHDVDHLMAKQRGRDEWYTHYRIRIAKVEMDYSFDKE